MVVIDAPNAAGGLPVKGDLRKAYKAQPLPTISAAALAATASDDANEITRTTLERLNSALQSNNAESFQSLFLAPAQAVSYWKDQVALTSHLRTFHGPESIAANFTSLAHQRGIVDGLKPFGKAALASVNPTLSFIDGRFEFTTRSPAATSRGRLLLVPVETSEGFSWKIWIIGTWMWALEGYPEDVNLLKQPAIKVGDTSDTLRTEVCIIGGGNSGACLSARLKSMGVDCLIVERNASAGDNWGLRYDDLKFHVTTSSATMPFLEYPKEHQYPHLLKKPDLTNHLKRYVEELNLNYITSAKIRYTEYNNSTKEWALSISTPQGEKTIVAKHVVLATGIGSQQPNLPSITGQDLYKGLSIHSRDFKNGRQLKEQGVKSALVVGSANTAFDVMESLHAGNIPQITMNVRSPTNLYPVTFVCDPRALGSYNTGVEAADDSIMTLPNVVDGLLAKGLFGFMASQQPDRYKALAEAGFPVMDALHPDSSLIHHLLERGGGHYIETGGHELIVQGKVAVKALVEPVAFTETGVKFSDGSTLDADAVVWCTGFVDSNVANVAFNILGGNDAYKSNGNGVKKSTGGDEILGPAEIAARVEPTWGIDTEGEVRGLWKRQENLDNFWILGGNTQHHRWFSRSLALQIKASLAGILPEPHRQTLGTA